MDDLLPHLAAAIERHAHACAAVAAISQERARDRRRGDAEALARRAAADAHLEIVACYVAEVLPVILTGEWQPYILSPWTHQRALHMTFRNHGLFGLPQFFRPLPYQTGRPARLGDLALIGSPPPIWVPHTHEVASHILKRAKACGVQYRVGIWARPAAGQQALVLASRRLRGRITEAPSYGFVGLV